MDDCSCSDRAITNTALRDRTYVFCGEYTGPMKPPEYTEGPKALDNFKALAGAILQANPKKKKKRPKKVASQENEPKSDKD
jgi:hypothetical protein